MCFSNCILGRVRASPAVLSILLRGSRACPSELVTEVRVEGPGRNHASPSHAAAICQGPSSRERRTELRAGTPLSTSPRRGDYLSLLIEPASSHSDSIRSSLFQFPLNHPVSSLHATSTALSDSFEASVRSATSLDCRSPLPQTTNMPVYPQREQYVPTKPSSNLGRYRSRPGQGAYPKPHGSSRSKAPKPAIEGVREADRREAQRVV